MANQSSSSTPSGGNNRNNDNQNGAAGGGANLNSGSGRAAVPANSDSGRTQAQDAATAARNADASRQSSKQAQEHQDRQRQTQQQDSQPEVVENVNPDTAPLAGVMNPKRARARGTEKPNPQQIRSNVRPRAASENVTGALEDVEKQASKIAKAAGVGGGGILDVTGLANVPVIGALSNVSDLKELGKQTVGGEAAKKDNPRAAMRARARHGEEKPGDTAKSTTEASSPAADGLKPRKMAGGSAALSGGANALRNGEGVKGAAKAAGKAAAQEVGKQAVKKVATQVAVKAGVGAAAGAATGGVSIAVQVGLEVLTRFIKKNPWSIPVFIVALFMPLILTVAIVGGTVTALGSLRTGGPSTSCGDSTYEQQVTSYFGSEKTLSKNETLAKSDLLNECGVGASDGACLIPGGDAQTTDFSKPVAGYSGDQLKNAAAIMNAATALKLPVQAQIIGVMTAMGESTLNNINYGDNAINPDGSVADSIGLFQQQSGWGSKEDRLNPSKSATFFFNAMVKKVPGWKGMDPNQVAHLTQVNADPNYYTKFLSGAKVIVSKLAGVTLDCDATNATYSYDAKYWKEIYKLAIAQSSKADYATSNVDDIISQMKTLITQGTGNDELRQDAISDLEGFQKNSTTVNIMWSKIASWAKAKYNHGYNSDIADQVIAAARTRVGTTYVLGGAWDVKHQYFCVGSSCGFDCARFVGWAMAQADFWGENTKSGSYTPGVFEGASGATAQYKYILEHGGITEQPGDISPGDLLYLGYSNDGTWDHVVIYTGQKDGVRQYIESATGHTHQVIERAAWWTGNDYRLQYVRPY